MVPTLAGAVTWTPARLQLPDARIVLQQTHEQEHI